MSPPALPQERAPLQGGDGIPLLGFGTWQLTGRQAENAVLEALRNGYRHLDTATMYRNEPDLSTALSNSRVPRDRVFITTKLPPQRSGAARRTLEESLRALDVDWVDLWLIHWPPVDGGREAWREFVKARDEGLARHIGVSNYSLAELDALAAASGVRPELNQIEWSPLLYDPEVAAGHQERGVVLEGYSGLKGGVLRNRTVEQVAERLGATPAQVVIRWHIDHGFVVIPKSAHAERIRENADVGELRLSPEDLAALDSVSTARAARQR